MTLAFYQSKDLMQPLSVKLGYIEGTLDKVPYSEIIEDCSKSLSLSGSRSPVSLLASLQVFSMGKPITEPIYSTYKHPQSDHTFKWNEWLELPIAINQLPLESLLVITVYGPSGGNKLQVYGGSTIPLFDTEVTTLRQGRQKLKAWLGEKGDGSPRTKTPWCTENSLHNMDRLEGLITQHQKGEIASIEWLDNLVFRKIEKINREFLNSDHQHHNLYVELPSFDFDVVFAQHHYQTASVTVSNTQQLQTPVQVFAEQDTEKPLAVTFDPDISKETPIEAKFRRLIRSATDATDLRPNAKIRDELAKIMTYSPVTELTSDERNLIWRFRYYLSRHSHTLTKFVNSVTWDDANEALKAIELIRNWSQIEVAEALELLGPDVENPDVRAYAVSRLRTASDGELELYLMQLVEALKFENYREFPTQSALAKLLVNRSVQNFMLGNFFYWYMYVQTSDRLYGKRIYEPILSHYLDALAHTNSDDQLSLQIRLQVKLINKLLDLANKVKSSKDSRPRRIQSMRDYISDPRNNLDNFLPTVLPLDPSIIITGCIPEKCTVFKSTMQPLKFTFKKQGGGEYSLIFKSGDDLRQDQLVMQIIMLMDKLLKDENLDLRLSPYSILATSAFDGAIEYMVNEPLSKVLSENHGILSFLKQHNGDPTQPLGVKDEVMDNFVRSTAGYAVITYLLGVGDRHLDNLLLNPNGKFFHIDFGYILGQDPKPFPPMIKLPIQLIDGMGGINSENYNRFKSYCFTAFITLRRSANLILALFNLMTESSIPTLMAERHQAVQKVEERFCLDMSEEEAILHFQNLINDSVNAFLPVVIDRLHSLAQYWRA